MTADDRVAFLAGDRPDDVLVYLDDDAVSNPEALLDYGDRVEGGVVLVLAGEKARAVFQRAAGIDPMAFAKRAMNTDGEVRPDCTGGVCPEADGEADADHTARFVFAFAEQQNPEVEGIYAEGDVIHAYVSCACGASYSDKWLAGER